MLIQPGENGQRQDTYRTVFEDDQQTAETRFKSQVIKEARPEIVMIVCAHPSVQFPSGSLFIYPLEMPG